VRGSIGWVRRRNFVSSGQSQIGGLPIGVKLEGRLTIPSPYLGGRGGFEAAVPLVASGRRAQTGQSRKAFSDAGPRVRTPSASQSVSPVNFAAAGEAAPRRRPFPRVCPGAPLARSAENRRARRHRANLGQYLCRAIFQYPVSGDAAAASCWVKIARLVPKRGRASFGAQGCWWILRVRIGLKQSRALSADRPSQAADGSARAASLPWCLFLRDPSLAQTGEKGAASRETFSTPLASQARSSAEGHDQAEFKFYVSPVSEVSIAGNGCRPATPGGNPTRVRVPRAGDAE
jgi:hypothetical protein